MEDKTIDLNGVIELEEPIHIEEDDTVVSGPCKIIPQFESTPIVISDADSVRVSNITIEFTNKQANEKINGIEVNNATGTQIDDCTVRSTPGIGKAGELDAIGGGAGFCVRSTATDTTIVNCRAIDGGWRGFAVSGQQTIIENCTAYGQVDRGFSGDVQLPETSTEFDESATQLVIRNCNATGGTHPAAPFGFTGASQVRVVDSRGVTNPGRRGVSARRSEGVTVRNSDFVGRCSDPQEGIYSSSKGVKLVDNTLYGYEYGIRIPGEETVARGNTIGDCRHPIVYRKLSGNIVTNNTTHDISGNKFVTMYTQLRNFARRKI